MSLSARSVVFGYLLLLASIPVFTAETSLGSGILAAPRAYVNCPGVSSIPVTADVEQALPLTQVATLSCGEAVAVLSDSSGYTMHIRTAEGKEGDVAYMDLTREVGLMRPQVQAPLPPANAEAQNGVVRWRAGARGCEQFVSGGQVVESATANGVTVQVSLQDTGWKLRATIAVSNESGEKVYVLPALITLDELRPGLRSLRQESPTKLARYKANHQLIRPAYNAQPSVSAVAYRSSSTVSPKSSPVENYLANTTDAPPVKGLVLKMTNLAPGQKTAGELWFAREAKARELSMRLSIGDVVYDFPFSFKEKK